jgi:hypothetical protein
MDPIRIQEAQQHTDPTDPDPQHWIIVCFLLLGRDHAGESEGVGPGVHEANAALQVLGEDAHRGDEEDPRLPQGILPGLHTSTDNFFPVPSNANSSDAFSSLKSVIRNRVVDPVSKLFLLFLLLWFIFAHLDPDPANQKHCGSTPLGITKSFCPLGQNFLSESTFYC